MRLRVFILFSILCFGIAAQSSIRRSNIDFISVETGFIVDTYNSFGARLAFEYQKQFNHKWLYGIAYEHSTHFDYAFDDKEYELRTNLNILSLNGYRRINITKKLIFLTTGAGIGVAHINWMNNNKVGLSANASITLNIRITERIYAITSPLLVLTPFNRIHVSTIKLKNFSNFYAYTTFPVGIKVQL